MTAYAPLFGAKWTDSKGNSTLSKDPQWAKFLKWQKSLVDYYGYKQLVKFPAGAADEFSASNAFEIGHLAMAVVGEWRGSLDLWADYCSCSHYRWLARFVPKR